MKTYCWFCGDEMIWENNLNYNEIHNDECGGIVSILKCTNKNCNAQAEFSKKENEERND